MNTLTRFGKDRVVDAATFQVLKRTKVGQGMRN
jgi:hypothetical protein